MKVIRPLYDVYEWFDYLDYCDEQEGYVSRLNLPTGFYKAKIISIHKCFEDEREYYIFVFTINFSGSKNYFHFTTRAFNPDLKVQNDKLLDFISTVTNKDNFSTLCESTIANLVGTKCLVHIQEYSEHFEKFIDKCFPLKQTSVSTIN